MWYPNNPSKTRFTLKVNLSVKATFKHCLTKEIELVTELFKRQRERHIELEDEYDNKEQSSRKQIEKGTKVPHRRKKK